MDIAIVGKYIKLHNSYLSVIKSLEYSAMHYGKKPKLVRVDTSHLKDQFCIDDPAAFHKVWHQVCTANGILIPGGFGHRGTKGVVQAPKWVRAKREPISRHLSRHATSYHRIYASCLISPTPLVELNAECLDPIVISMPEIDWTTLDSTTRLSLRRTFFHTGSKWSRLRQLLDEQGQRMEIEELKEYQWYLGVLFHLEYESRASP